MRKRIINQSEPQVAAVSERWLDLERHATVEVSSEQSGYPVEAALLAEGGPGWRAAEPGRQILRLLFDEPQALRLIHLVFEEHQRVRTQEMVLRWSTDGGASYREIVRQQFNFSPPHSSRETEDYNVELQGVTTLELAVVPEIGGGGAHAALAELRLA
jgi:hypothetical protein